MVSAGSGPGMRIPAPSHSLMAPAPEDECLEPADNQPEVKQQKDHGKKRPAELKRTWDKS